VQLSAIRTEVNRQVGLPLDPLLVTQLINASLRRIADHRDWPWLDLAESGLWPAAEVHPLVAAAKSVKSVIVSDQRLNSIAEADADSYDGTWHYDGYSVTGRQLRVVPRPAEGAAFTIRYIAYENTLTADANEPLLPNAHIDAVVALVCSMAHNRPEGNTGARDRFRDEYTDTLRGMVRAARPTRGARQARTRQDTI